MRVPDSYVTVATHNEPTQVVIAGDAAGVAVAGAAARQRGARRGCAPGRERRVSFRSNGTGCRCIGSAGSIVNHPATARARGAQHLGAADARPGRDPRRVDRAGTPAGTLG